MKIGVYNTNKLCRAILLYQQLSCLVELPVGTSDTSFNVNMSLKLYYRDVELCQGIWALNGSGVLFLRGIYLCPYICIAKRHFTEYLFLLSSNC